jgi:predicted TIM-barrel fold metal-dependent hydrolase
MAAPVSRSCTSALCNCGSRTGGISRRGLLTGGSAALALGAAPRFIAEAVAQTPATRIDVHHHISAPTWLDALKSMNKGNAPIMKWSPQKSIDDMDKGGVATAITSPAPPHLQDLDTATAARVARESNEYAKKLEAQHPGRFGTWAMLPLPYVDDSLKEIEYAFDTLKVDGVGCMTSYGDTWLGYAEFDPVWAELNRRKATVYTHPTAPECCGDLVRGIDASLIEFGTDTARAIFTVVYGGVAAKYPDINWIWSHGGGVLISLAERFLDRARFLPPNVGKFTRADVNAQLRRFYYDTAMVANDVALSGMVKLMPISRIVFGTDFPYRPAAGYTDALAAFFKSDELKAIYRDNALRLIPRLKAA